MFAKKCALSCLSESTHRFTFWSASELFIYLQAFMNCVVAPVFRAVLSYLLSSYPSKSLHLSRHTFFLLPLHLLRLHTHKQTLTISNWATLWYNHMTCSFVINSSDLSLFIIDRTSALQSHVLALTVNLLTLCQSVLITQYKLFDRHFRCNYSVCAKQTSITALYSVALHSTSLSNAPVRVRLNWIIIYIYIYIKVMLANLFIHHS